MKNSALAVKLLLLVSLGSVLIFLTACGGAGAATPNPIPLPPNPQPQQPPSISSFSPSVNGVTVGGSVTLTWTTANATSVTLSPDPRPAGSPALAVRGFVTFNATATTTYTLTATGPGGSTTSNVTITVNAPDPPAITFTASPTTITAGSISTITWSTTNTTTVSILPDPRTEPEETPFATASSLPVTPATTTTYVLTAIGPTGLKNTASVTITVQQVPPTLTFTATPAITVPNSPVALNWSTQNATSLVIDNGINSVALPSGTINVSPAVTTTYHATATGPGGTTSASATVTVTPPGQVGVTLSASADTISAGQSVTLTWVSQNATSVSIQPPPATTVGLNGTATVSPTTTTTYTATATDVNGNTATSSATVTVSGAGDLNSKIKHIIFLVQENRSFDSYFGKLGAYRLAKGVTTAPNGDIDAFDPNVKLPDRNGANLVSPFHYRTVCEENLSPQWNESHIHYDGGKMDGYMRTPVQTAIDPLGHRAMGHFDETDLPYYYELATQFATADETHSPVLSNTIPNRMYLFTATSFGHTVPDATVSAGQYTQPTIFDLMTQHSVSWKYYFQDNSVFLFQFATWTNNNGAEQAKVQNINSLFTTLADPNADNLLPSVSFIERATATGLDEHPGENVQTGAAQVKKIIDAVMRSAAWQSTIFVLTFDEGGAIYDHVPPITVPAPDTIPPNFKPGGDLPGDFTLTGFRVPFIVVSPWVKKNYVSHVPRDYTSILKLIETRFGLPSLTARDQAADPMLDFFDFTTASWLTPPPLPDQPTGGTCDNKLETGP